LNSFLMRSERSLMSNKILTDSQGALATADFRRRFRRTWIISGFVLWTLVFAAALGLFVLRHRERPSDDAAAPAALVLADSATSGGSSSDQLTTPPLPPWSPAGVEDFVFTERSGRKVTKADLLGHPWLISFIFTRCAGPCPRVSGQMSELQTLLKGTQVRLVTLTVDPDFDTTEVLTHYAQAYRADPNRWLYLTGDKRKTYRLINNSFLMPVKEYTGKDREPGYEVMHSTNILLVNEKGVVVQKYNALDEVDLARLRRDLKPYLDAKGSQTHGQGAKDPPVKQPAIAPKGSSH
jgi:protein SCO1